jgi:NitT/TauT family transport system substrate-binding protein
MLATLSSAAAVALIGSETGSAQETIRYARWREYDPEDTVRFYSLRLREAGMIKSIPSKIIAQGTDWRFFNELKQELKS